MRGLLLSNNTCKHPRTMCPISRLRTATVRACCTPTHPTVNRAPLSVPRPLQVVHDHVLKPGGVLHVLALSDQVQCLCDACAVRLGWWDR